MERAENRDRVVFWLLLAAVFAITLSGGGLSWQECLIPLVILAAVLILCRRRFCAVPEAWLLPLFAGLGALSLCLTAGDKQIALYEYEKLWCLILAIPVGLSLRDEDAFLKLTAYAAGVTAIFGLLAVCHVIRLPDFIFEDRYMERLQSFLGYANATALLLGCGFFAAAELFQRHQKRLLSHLATSVLLAFYLTGSKACVLLFLALITVLMFQRREYARFFILQNLCAMLFAVLIVTAGTFHARTLQFLFMTVGVILGGWLPVREEKKKDKTLLLWVWMLGAALFLAAACVLFFLRGTDVLGTLRWRGIYAKDALCLLKTHPIFGIGPGAWRYYQYVVQSTGYNVTTVHNGWIQLWLEYGIGCFGILLFLVWRAAWRLFRARQAIPLTILLLIFFHSLVDFGLSYALMLILLGLLLGAALRREASAPRSKAALPILLTAALLIEGYALAEFVLRTGFETAYRRGDEAAALRRATRLAELCPGDSHLQISLGALEEKDAGDRIQRAVMLSPMDIDIRKREIEYALSHRSEDILSQCMNYVDMAKKQESVYRDAADYAEEAFESGLCTKAQYDDFIKRLRAKRTEEQVIDRNELLDETVRKGE